MIEGQFAPYQRIQFEGEEQYVGLEPPVFVAAQTGNAAAVSATQTVTKPTGTVDGDIMLVEVAQHSSGQAVTPPAGWTLLATQTANSPSTHIYGKVASSEPASWNWVWASNSAQKGYTALAYRGGAGLIDVTGAYSKATSATQVAASITAGNAGVLLAFYAISGSRTVSTPPSGMTQRAIMSSANCSCTAYELTPSPTGASGTKTLVWSTSSFGSAVLVQVY